MALVLGVVVMLPFCHHLEGGATEKKAELKGRRGLSSSVVEFLAVEWVIQV